MTALYLHACHRYLPDQVDDTTLRQQLKHHHIDARRMARFSQLALLGALPLRDFINTHTAIYLASPYSSPSKFNAAFYALHQRNLPSPLDFMANTHNAAVFHLAQLFEIESDSLFISIAPQQYWQPVFLAQQHLLINPTQQALIGWALEASEVGQQEGSCWWLISLQEKGAIAKIKWSKTVQQGKPHHQDFLVEFREWEAGILQ